MAWWNPLSLLESQGPRRPGQQMDLLGGLDRTLRNAAMSPFTQMAAAAGRTAQQAMPLPPATAAQASPPPEVAPINMAGIRDMMARAAQMRAARPIPGTPIAPAATPTESPPPPASVINGPFMGPLDTSGGGRPIVSDVASANPPATPPGISFMSMPDMTPERLLQGAALRFGTAFDGAGRFVGDLSEQRNDALRSLMGIQAAREAQAAETAAGRERNITQLEAERIRAAAQGSRDRAELLASLMEQGQPEDEAMRIASGAPPMTSQANINAPTDWRSGNIRRLLDEAAQVTTNGLISSRPGRTINDFVSTLQQQYPHMDFSRILDDYIRARWPAADLERAYSPQASGLSALFPARTPQQTYTRERRTPEELRREFMNLHLGNPEAGGIFGLFQN